VLALTVPGRNGLLRNRAAPRVNAAIVAATVPPEFARVHAPVLALYSESTVADAFPWLTKASPEYERASAVFHEQLRPMILLERQKFARANTRATIDTFRAHHYMFLSHPDETDGRAVAAASRMPTRRRERSSVRARHKSANPCAVS
jgi:hypothetical protein